MYDLNLTHKECSIIFHALDKVNSLQRETLKKKGIGRESKKRIEQDNEELNKLMMFFYNMCGGF